MTELLSLDIADLVAGFREKRFSPVEAVRAVLDAAERANPVVNAFASIDRDGALADAAASEARWHSGQPKSPLDGVPFTVKDNVLWSGRTTRRGSRTTDETDAVENAPAVDRLLEAGAVPFAKTTLPEFGWKGLGDSPLYGITRNPWDTRQTCGGSSAGAAVAAALGIGPIHIGTDGAGSIRIPASFCGVFGLKPSFGRVSAYPPSPFAIVSHLGPLTRSVADAAMMLGVIGMPDPYGRDISALVTPIQNYLAGLEVGVAGVRIAWSPRLGYVEGLDPEVEDLCRKALTAFEDGGAEIEEADPGFDDPKEILNPLWQTGAWSVLRSIPESRWSEIDPGFVAQAEIGRTISGSDFVAAANARGAFYERMTRFHERYDLLLTPTLAVPAFTAGHNTPTDGRYGSDWLNWTPYSYPFNLTMQPAASVPCGLTAAGLPVGLQIVGAMHRDGAVLRAARAYEKARPWPRLDAPRVTH